MADKKCIVYYSRSGNTREASFLMAKKRNLHLFEIEEEHKPKNIFSTLYGGIKAKLGIKSKIAGTPFLEIKDYNIVYLFTPVWFSSTPPAVNSFIEKSDFKDKIVKLIIMQSNNKNKCAYTLSNKIIEKVNRLGGTCQLILIIEAGNMFFKLESEKVNKQIEDALEKNII